MTDRELILALRALDRPVEPDPAFADALFARLRGEGRSRRPSRVALLIAAALVLIAAVAAALIVGGWLRNHETTLPGMFRPVGALNDHRDAAASAVLADGRVLVVGGTGRTLEPIRAELFDPATGTFGWTGSLSSSRTSPTATTLADGRILVAGGSRADADGSQVAVASADLYDPTTGKFLPTGAMAQARTGQTATLLADGRVLVTGGSSFDAGQPIALDSAEIYDPASGTWTQAGPMPEPRFGHAAALLRDGRVLVVGGASSGWPTLVDPSSSPVGSALAFDPRTRSFAEVGPMSTGRSGATATRLQDGRVLVVGGVASATPTDAGLPETTLASAELFDPATGTFTGTGSLTTERSHHAATLLRDGRVLVSGGFNGNGQPLTAELYDPETGAFKVAATAASQHDGLAALLADGRVLLPDGDQPELFDPAGNAPSIAAPGGADPGFAVTGSPIADRTAHTATRLSDGRVLIAGGLAVDDRRVLASAEIYDPKTGTFSPTRSLTEPRSGHAALLLGDGRVLIAGGTTTGDTPLTSVELFDPGAGTFTSGNPLDVGAGLGSIRPRVRLLQSADGRIVVVGPMVQTGQDQVTTVTEVDPTSLSTARRSALADCYLSDVAALADGRILVACISGRPGTTSLRAYDPATGRAGTVGTYDASSFPNRVVGLPDGRVLLVDLGGPTNLAVFDPRTGTTRETGSSHDPNEASDAVPVVLADGRVLLDGVQGVWTWDPVTGTTSRVAAPGVMREDLTLTRLEDGRVLLVGGAQQPADRTVPRPPGAELFDPAAP